jgi:hypothetical protein
MHRKHETNRSSMPETHLSDSRLRRKIVLVLSLRTAQAPLVRPLFGWSQFCLPAGIIQDPVHVFALNTQPVYRRKSGLNQDDYLAETRRPL